MFIPTRLFSCIMLSPYNKTYHIMKKVNFGSGNISPEGWISLDSSPSVLLAKIPYSNLIKMVLNKINLIDKDALKTSWPSNIIFWDFRWGIPFRDNSIDIIFTSHFLEHLPQKNALNFLNKCYKILKNGGIIRIIVPDIDIILNNYSKGFRGNQIDATNELNLRFFEEGQHKHMYNYNSLSSILSSIGFKNIKKLDYRKSKITDIDKLETPKLKYYTSLYIEANK